MFSSLTPSLPPLLELPSVLASFYSSFPCYIAGFVLIVVVLKTVSLSGMFLANIDASLPPFSLFPNIISNGAHLTAVFISQRAQASLEPRDRRAFIYREEYHEGKWLL
jgi:uncharacterized membrane protein